ncbi:MAG: magnesium transporter [Gemmatimonadetes bacterium GWC2_71_10]|nr:MAG: magnesium transporter [Gemmatimonadetes bacterium GWC2_71_10]
MSGPVPPATELATEIARRGARDSIGLVSESSVPAVVEALLQVRPAVAHDLLAEMAPAMRDAVLAAAPPDVAPQWKTSTTWPEDSLGRLMEAPRGVFAPTLTVGQAIEQIREIVKQVFVTYLFVTGPGGRLIGVITFRDLLLSPREKLLADIMLQDPFFLRADSPLMDAMKLVLNRHFPVYPVCDGEGRLVGLVRGQTMFEEQAIEISAQAGSMVGVDKEERLATPWPRSLQARHPWLQLNLLTAFLAAAVVGVFQGTIDRLVILAMFLPVLAGQSGNTGCQALAVALRGLTLGELRPGRERALVMKEGLLGLLNGSLVGVSAGIGMYVVARSQQNPDAMTLAVVVWAAMVGACVTSGISGAIIPLTLRRLGFDPATASSIFLTTATDVVSMGMLLGLATIFV